MANSSEIKLIAENHARKIQQENFNQFQQAFETWNAQQEGFSQFEAEYNNWLGAQGAENTAPSVSVSQGTNKIPSLKSTVDDTVARANASFDANRARQAIENRQRFLDERSGKSSQKSNSDFVQNNGNSSLYGLLKKAGNMDYLNNKALEDLSAFEQTQKGKRAKANEELERQIVNSDKYVQPNQAAMSDADKELEEQILNSDRYVVNDNNKPNWNENLLSNADRSRIANKTSDETVANWLNPNYKLEGKEKNAARYYANSELAKFNYGANRQPLLTTDEERQHYADMVAILNKTSPLASASTGMLEPFRRVGQTLRDVGVDVGGQIAGLGASLYDKFGNGDGQAYKNVNEQLEQLKDFNTSIDEQGTLANQNAKTQNPGLYTAGYLGGNMAMYGITNPAYDAAAEALGATSTVGKFVANQIGQNAQDIMLDTIPTLHQYMQDGVLSDEERNQLIEGAINNAKWNGFAGALSEGAKKIGHLMQSGTDTVENAARSMSDDDIVVNEINLVPVAEQGLNDVGTTAPIKGFTDGIAGNPDLNTGATTQQSERTLSDLNVADTANNVNKNLQDRFEPDEELFYRLDSAAEELAAPMDNVRMSGIMNNVTDQKALTEWDNLNKAYSEYFDAAMDGNNLEEIKAAKNKFDATRKRYSRAMNNINPNVAKEFGSADYGRKTGRLFYERNLAARNAQYSDEAADAILELEGIGKADDSKVMYEDIGLNNSGKNSLENTNTMRYDNGVNVVNNTNNGGVNYGRQRINRASDTRDIRPNELNTIRQENSGALEKSRTIRQNDSGVSVLLLDKNTRSHMDAAKITNLDLKDYSDNYQVYSDGLNKSRIANRYGFFVDNQSAEDLTNSNAKAFMSSNGGAGVAVKSDGDIVGVYKNPQVSKERGAVEDLLITARSQGGNKLDCYGSNLVDKYSKCGFEPVARVPYQYGINPEMDAFCKSQKAANPNFTEPDIYFMKVRDGESVKDTIQGIKDNTFKLYSNEELNALPEMSYDEAAKYRDSLIKEQNGSSFFNGGNSARPQGDSIVGTWEYNERGQSKHIRGQGKMQMEGVSDEVKAAFNDDPDMYTRLGNKETKLKAEDIYNTSDNPEREFRDLLAKKDPAALPLGHQLAKDYSAKGDYAAASQIYRDMGAELTKAGQFTQAAAINMMKNDPMTALEYVQKQLDKLNEQGAKRFGKKWTDFSLTDDEFKLFENIKPGDEEAIKNAFDTIGERIGKYYPTTMMDKLLEGRKVAMLFNVRTNVRNFGANIPTLGMRWTSDRIEALGQKAYAKLINPDFEVTQSVKGGGRAERKLATEVYNSPKVQAMLDGDVGKYEIPELRNSLVKNKQMYKGTAVSRWIDDVTGGGIQKVNEKLFGKKGVQSGLETVRNATYKMLDIGDTPFVKENFVERLASYLETQGIKNIDNIPDEAIEVAWAEAMKATYKDNSWAVKMLSGIKNGIESVPYIGRPISQAAIPFLQAPGNIAARMVDYSPIRGTKGIADIISGTRAGDMKKVTRGIEEAAKGLTGTGLVLLGMRLRDSGILTGSYSDDKDQKAFEKQNGFKEFALHVGDKYFTYDWVQPFAEPLIIGTLLSDAINKSDEYNSDLLSAMGIENPTANRLVGAAKEGAKASVNSWFNASPLQGMQELLSGGYSGEDIAENIKKVMVDDFVGAFVPASLNAVAKSADYTQRNTYDPSNSVKTFANQQIAKIPGLSKTLPAKYDTWGREMKYADNAAMATASRFVIPGDYSYDRNDRIDNEINRLYEGTGNAAVFPQVAQNKVGDNKLDNRQISAYQKDMGERSRIMAETFIDSDIYESMDDASRAETLSNLYGVSKAITERDKFDKPLADNSSYKKAVEAYDNAGGGEDGAKAVVDYYAAKSYTDSAGLLASSNAAKAIQEDVQSGNLEAAEEKKDAAQTLQELGLDKPGPINAYYNAQEKIPGLTVEDFASTYKAIDTDGNQGIKQDEVIDYLNRKKITSQNEAMQIWSAYGTSTWKQIPSLNNGTWTKKKK